MLKAFMRNWFICVISAKTQKPWGDAQKNARKENNKETELKNVSWQLTRRHDSEGKGVCVLKDWVGRRKSSKTMNRKAENEKSIQDCQ